MFGGAIMTEKDKMLAGEWYDANYDEDLEKEAKRTIYVLN